MFDKLFDSFNYKYINGLNEELKSIYVYDYYINNHSDFESIAIKTLQFSIDSRFTYKKIKHLLRFTPYNIIEQYDVRLNKLKLVKKIKFGENVYYYWLNCLVYNKLTDDNGNFIRIGLFGLKPIIRLSGRKHWETIEKKEVITKKIFGKLNFTKNYNVGWKFPGSFFKENQQEKSEE